MILPQILLPRLLFDECWRLLASFSTPQPSEGVVYWFGVESPRYSIVTSLMVPNAVTTRGGLRTSASANAEVLESIIGTPLVLLGQAHSHPSDWVEHSPTDDRHTFAAFEGGLSVVVPSFAFGDPVLAACGIHRVIGGAFRSISIEEVPNHLCLLPSVTDFRREPSSRGSRRE